MNIEYLSLHLHFHQLNEMVHQKQKSEIISSRLSLNLLQCSCYSIKKGTRSKGLNVRSVFQGRVLVAGLEILIFKREFILFLLIWKVASSSENVQFYITLSQILNKLFFQLFCLLFLLLSDLKHLSRFYYVRRCLKIFLAAKTKIF